MQNLAQVAAEQLATSNAFNIPKVPPSARNLGTYKIFNINYWRPHWVQELGTLGSFLISAAEEGFRYEPNEEGEYIKRACKDGEIAYSRPCLVPKVIREGAAVDLRKIAFTEWDGLEVAADIMGVGPRKQPNQDLTRWGVFLAAGDVPTKQELETAKKALSKKAEELWAAAQSLYLQGPAMIVEITDVHRQADVYLKRRAQWNQEAMQMIACPGCGDSVFASAAAHLACGAILDEKKVVALKLKGFEHLWKKGA